MKKMNRLVITFPTPTDAFALEAACKAAGIAGRLLPVPVSLSGGCGIGWTGSVEQKSLMEKFIEEHNLAVKLVTEIVF